MVRATKPRSRKDPYRVVKPLALALPGVEEGTSYGTPAFRVRKKLFARVHPDGESLALRVDPAGRDVLLEEEPDVFFITDVAPPRLVKERDAGP